MRMICAIGVAAMATATFGQGTTKLDPAAWQAYSDKVAGGTSSITLTTVRSGPSGATAMRAEGEMTPAFSFPFAGTQIYFDAKRTAHDVTGQTGVQFAVRGDGRTYALQAITTTVLANKDNNYFAARIETSDKWTVVRMPFKDLTQIIPNAKKVEWTGKDVLGFGVAVTGFTGKYWFEIADIAVY